MKLAADVDAAQVQFLVDAIPRIRRVLCMQGESSVATWTLLYAAQSLATGRFCLGYNTPDAMDRLVADITAFLRD